MKSPLPDWIDAHSGVRHNLAKSGMVGSIPRPWDDGAGTGDTPFEELREEFARSTGVSAERVFLTHGATEANAWVMWFLSRMPGRAGGWCRVRYPEYPPLFEVARWAGFQLSTDARRASLAVVSRPRNPEGDLWPLDRLFEWGEGSAHLLVDETFREFAGAPSVASEHRPGLWATGTLTKFFAADDLRVGFVVAPEEAAKQFGAFVGLVGDELPPASVWAALSVLRHRSAIRETVEGVIGPNRAAFQSRFPEVRPPVAPVYFDRGLGENGDQLAHRCLDASVLVCPGSYFGEADGIRLCLTRRTFPADLDAYLAVRDSPRSGASVRARDDHRTVRDAPAGQRTARVRKPRATPLG
jgi:histidinol-phosphate/aromatic aminotransferase/cobyric acid decarboxylase-like protein